MGGMDGDGNRGMCRAILRCYLVVLLAGGAIGLSTGVMV